MTKPRVSIGSGIPHWRALVAGAGVLLGASLTGVAIPLYVGAIGEGVARMMALPALFLLALLFLYSRKALLLLIILFRASGDIFLEATRFSLGGYQIGVGGLINAFVILIVLLLAMEKPDVLPRKVIAPWAGFLLFALVGVAISPVKADAIRSYLSLLSYFAIFLSAFYMVRSADDFRFCVKVILWSSAIPAAYALVELATGSAHRAGGFRLQSTFGHPNIFAFYLTLVISLTLYMLKSSARAVSPGLRLGLNLYMLLLLALLMLTQTRSAWIACFMLFAVYGLFFERRYLAYLVLTSLFALLIPGVLDRLLDLGAGNEYVQYARLNSFAWRRLIWETGLQWMRPDHYLLGYGLESFKHYSLVFFPLANPMGSGHGAHNIYVQLLFEVGALGLLAYVWLFGRLLWFMKSLPSLDRLAGFVSIAAIAAYLIVSSSDNILGYLSFNWYFWFMVGVACSVVAAALKPEPEVRRPGLPGSHPGFREGTVRSLP